MQRQTHPFAPICDQNAEILILGTFPSVKSRENHFYYGHPQNRFWPLLAELYRDKLPVSVEEKTDFLHRHHIALWDVLESCEIKASADSSIKAPAVNDIAALIQGTSIKTICFNGKKAQSLFEKYIGKIENTETISLPSTSPANAAFHKERLRSAWKIIRQKQTTPEG